MRRVAAVDKTVHSLFWPPTPVRCARFSAGPICDRTAQLRSSFKYKLKPNRLSDDVCSCARCKRQMRSTGATLLAHDGRARTRRVSPFRCCCATSQCVRVCVRVRTFRLSARDLNQKYMNFEQMFARALKFLFFHCIRCWSMWTVRSVYTLLPTDYS